MSLETAPEEIDAAASVTTGEGVMALRSDRERMTRIFESLTLLLSVALIGMALAMAFEQMRVTQVACASSATCDPHDARSDGDLMIGQGAIALGEG